MGLREIETKIQQDRAWQQKRVNLLLDDLESILNNRTNLKERLQIFETKYKNVLGSFPTIVQKIEEIKKAAGIMDLQGEQKTPTITPHQITPNKIPVDVKTKPVLVPQCPTFWEKLAGRGPYYSQLALKILEIGQEIQKETGGLIRLGDLVLRINKGRTMHGLIDIKDIEKALRRLEKDQLIPGLRQISSGEWIVEFIPTILDQDVISILSIANRKGWVSLEEIVIRKNWTPERVLRILKGLEKMGVARYDDNYRLGQRWYFPGLKIKDTEASGEYTDGS